MNIPGPYPTGGYQADTGVGPAMRRRRIEFLMRVLDAPEGIKRPGMLIKHELDILLEDEFGAAYEARVQRMKGYQR